MPTLIIVIIAVALLFDFMNGRNDAANSIATVVSTRVLTPFLGVLWAAFWNFAALLIFGVHVANNNVKAWILTIPVTIIISGGIYYIFSRFLL